MSASSHTANINLSQFTSSDKPTWLGDYNGDMSKIDAAFAAKEAELNTLRTQYNALFARVTALATATGNPSI